MQDKILSFILHGFLLGVEQDQIEKILINKHPVKNTFTLETGVEVKSLDTYIPLPAKEEAPAENILFVKDQKDFYGFTVDSVPGYIRLKDNISVHPAAEKSPIKYFVKTEGRLIPVLDLQYITNNENVVTSEVIEEIVSCSPVVKNGIEQEERDDVFHDVREEEVYRSIEEEINRGKKYSYADNVIESEKKGIILPLIVNIAIIVFFISGLVFYLTVNRERVREQALGESISGVEEEVIKEIRRRSEEEVAEQKQKLNDAKKRLNALQEESDYFLQNQDKILATKERILNEDYEKELEEARLRIMASGTSNVDEEFEKERARLNAEFLKSRHDAREEIEKVKKEYEKALVQKEDEIQREVSIYSKKIDNIQQKLVEEQAKLKEAEEKFQSTVSSQQEYLTFRRQLNAVYNRALGYFSQEKYARGIKELDTILPVIEKARKSGIGKRGELEVEEKLVKNILFLAKSEQNRVDLNQIAQKTYEAAAELENLGNLKEALSRYFTVYTIADGENFKNRAFRRAESIMDEIFNNRTESEKKVMNEAAAALFDTAMDLKNRGEYDKALAALEELITDLPGTTKIKDSLDEIEIVNNLKARNEDALQKEELNERASELMKSARDAYTSGFYTDALEKYEEVVRKFRWSDYSEAALSEIVRINEYMRSLKTSTPVVLQGEGVKIGVIIQQSSANTFLFNLGTNDGIEKGDVLGIYRREGEGMSFIGNVKVSEVYPTISKGKIMYYEKEIKVGDIVSSS